MEEQQLIASVLRGNNHAFTILVNQYKDMVFSICLKLTEDYQLAEEAAQDTFVKVFKSIGSFKQQSKFSSWIYRIAVNTSYNKIKQRKPLEQIDENTPMEFSSSIESGFEKLTKEDKLNCIQQALKQLSKLDSLILTLFYLEEMNIQELMVATDLSKANVKVKLHRARKKLNEVIRIIMKNEMDAIL